MEGEVGKKKKAFPEGSLEIPSKKKKGTPTT